MKICTDTVITLCCVWGGLVEDEHPCRHCDHGVFGRSDLRGRNEDLYRYCGHIVLCLGGLVEDEQLSRYCSHVVLGGLILEVGIKTCAGTVVRLCSV